MNNERAFTLIEMMIVLLVISVLLIITIPNITKHNSNIHTKGCSAFVKMVEAQVQAFQIDHNRLPTSLEELQKANYLTDKQNACPNGDGITIDSNGEVKVVKK